MVGLYRRGGRYLGMAVMAGRQGDKRHNHPWSRKVRANCAGVGRDIWIWQCRLVILVGLYRRGGRYMVMATLVGQRGDKRHNHPGSSKVRARCAGVGGDIWIGQCRLLISVGLYRRGGRYLVMTTLVGQHGGKGRNHPWSS